MIEVDYYDADDNCTAHLSPMHAAIVDFEHVEYYEVTKRNNVVKRTYVGHGE